MTLPEQRRLESAVSGVSYGFGTREELLAAGAEAVFGRIEEVEAYIENDEVKEGEAE